MAYRIEIIGQVENHGSRVSLLHILLYLPNGILCTSSQSVAEASVRKQWLIDRHDLLSHSLLDSAVDYRRNTKLSYSAVWLRDLFASHGRGSVMSSPYLLYEFTLMLL